MHPGRTSSVSTSYNITLSGSHEIEITLRVLGFLAIALCGFVIFAKISCGFAGSGIPLTPHSITVRGHGISTVAYGRSRTRCYPYTMAALGHEVNLLWLFSNMTSYYGLSRT